MNIATSEKVIGLANSLGLYDGDPVESIRAHCLNRVSEIVVRGTGSLDMDGLEDLVRKELNLGVHRVWSDQEFHQLIDDYLGQGELVFKGLLGLWGAEDYGVFIRLNKPNTKGEPWVCLIDCRGEKAYRRHWTFWHEATHCLTATEEMQLPLRRTTIPVDSKKPKDPLEVLTDYITRDLAFYAPIFDPALGVELAQSGSRISFELVEKVRRRFCPEASFESTMNRILDRCGIPCIAVEAGLNFNKKERKAIENGDRSIQPSLRISRIYANAQAKDRGLFIPRNYRVPGCSVIALAHCRPEVVSRFGLKRTENLGDWSDSSGRTLGEQEIYVEARRLHGRVGAIIGCATSE